MNDPSSTKVNRLYKSFSAIHPGEAMHLLPLLVSPNPLFQHFSMLSQVFFENSLIPREGLKRSGQSKPNILTLIVCYSRTLNDHTHGIHQVATVIAVYANWGFAQIHGIGWGWAGVVWLYSIITFFPLDILKFIIRYSLSGQAWDNLVQNKVVLLSSFLASIIKELDQRGITSINFCC